MAYNFGDKLKPTAELLKTLPRLFHAGYRAVYVGTDKHGDIMIVVQGKKKVASHHPKFWEKE